MTRRAPDNLDLFTDWTPPETPVVAPEFDRSRVAGVTDSYRVSRALGEAASECALDRDQIHAAMQEYMGKDFSRDVLDKYFSPAAEHDMPSAKLIAFLHVVPDLRVVNELLKGTGFSAIPDKYVYAVEDALLAEQEAQLRARRRAANSRWKGALS